MMPLPTRASCKGGNKHITLLPFLPPFAGSYLGVVVFVVHSANDAIIVDGNSISDKEGGAVTVGLEQPNMVTRAGLTRIGSCSHWFWSGFRLLQSEET